MLSALSNSGILLPSIALCVIAYMWLRYCKWTSSRHSPKDAERLIEAAGRFFPLRPRVPKRQREQTDDEPTNT